MNNLPKYNNNLFTIGQLPTSYLVSMTYEEQLLWLCNYLQKTILPKIDELTGIVSEILGDYQNIDEYIQEKLNDFLEEFAEHIDQTTETIINDKISSGEITVSLGETYDSEEESLDLFIQVSEE